MSVSAPATTLVDVTAVANVVGVGSRTRGTVFIQVVIVLVSSVVTPVVTRPGSPVPSPPRSPTPPVYT